MLQNNLLKKWIEKCRIFMEIKIIKVIQAKNNKSNNHQNNLPQSNCNLKMQVRKKISQNIKKSSHLKFYMVIKSKTLQYKNFFTSHYSLS